MAIDFLVTIDTEADNEWSAAGPRTYDNIALLPRFQALCDQYGIRPSYLTTYDVTQDDAAWLTLLKLADEGNCEIGAHLHAWSTPPDHELTSSTGARQPYLHEFPAAVQREKLARLTAALMAATDRPVSYRGGRWSFDGVAARLLADSGYLVDTTVTPGISWTRNPGQTPESGGPDYSGAGVTPYRLHTHEVTLPGALPLLEVPVSIMGRGPLSGLAHQAPSRPGTLHRLSGLRQRALNRSGLCRLVWLRPGYSTTESMLWLCDHVLARQAPVLNLMFHSSELIPGGSPRIRSREDAARVWDALEAIFRHVTLRLALRPLTLAEYARQWWEQQAANPPEVLEYVY